MDTGTLSARAELLLALNAIGRLVVCGRIAELADYFDAPLSLYVHGKFVLKSRPEEVRAGLMAFHAAMSKGGVARANPHLLRIEQSSQFRRLALVSWDYLDAQGDVLSSSTVRYLFCRGPVAGQMKVQMAEYHVLGLPKVDRIAAPLFGN
jgi:hypothetical protein